MRAITSAADPWLDELTTADLLANAVNKGKPIPYTYGNLLQRVIYHYWYHTGENMAILVLEPHALLHHDSDTYGAGECSGIA